MTTLSIPLYGIELKKLKKIAEEVKKLSIPLYGIRTIYASGVDSLRDWLSIPLYGIVINGHIIILKVSHYAFYSLIWDQTCFFPTPKPV